MKQNYCGFLQPEPPAKVPAKAPSAHNDLVALLKYDVLIWPLHMLNESGDSKDPSHWACATARIKDRKPIYHDPLGLRRGCARRCVVACHLRVACRGRPLCCRAQGDGRALQRGGGEAVEMLKLDLNSF